MLPASAFSLHISTSAQQWISSLTLTVDLLHKMPLSPSRDCFMLVLGVFVNPFPHIQSTHSKVAQMSSLSAMSFLGDPRFSQPRSCNSSGSPPSLTCLKIPLHGGVHVHPDQMHEPPEVPVSVKGLSTQLERLPSWALFTIGVYQCLSLPPEYAQTTFLPHLRVANSTMKILTVVPLDSLYTASAYNIFLWTVILRVHDWHRSQETKYSTCGLNSGSMLPLSCAQPKVKTWTLGTGLHNSTSSGWRFRAASPLYTMCVVFFLSVSTSSIFMCFALQQYKIVSIKSTLIKFSMHFMQQSFNRPFSFVIQLPTM